MQANLTHHTPTRKSIKVTVPAAEVSEEFGKVLAKLAPKAKIPGFRPGKAPKDVLMARFEREIHAEVAENLVNKHFWTAATDAGTQPISRPALEKVELKEGQDGTFNAHFDVAPEVKLPEYKGLTVLKQKRLIDDEAVDGAPGRPPAEGRQVHSRGGRGRQRAISPPSTSRSSPRA